MSEDDLKNFQKYFELSTDSKSISSHPLVKAGGMASLVASYLKQNKKVYKRYNVYKTRWNKIKKIKMKTNH